MPKPSNPSYQAIVAAPTFAVGVRCDADELIALEYLEPCAEQAPTLPLAAEAVRQIRAYLADPAYVFGLPLRPSGTHFQRKVWQAIAAIPCGQTQSYGEVAKAIRTNAPRAVGQACGANPFPLIVPCHRVLAAGGALGGFGRGNGDFLLDIKRWLLRHEGC